MNEFNEIKNLIGKARLSTALDRLKLIVPKEYKSDIVGLSSQLAELKRKNLRGTISNNEENIERNKIVSRVLGIMNLIEEEGKEGKKVDTEPSADDEGVRGESGDGNSKVLYLTSCPLHPKGRYSKINSGDEVELVNSAGLDIEFKPIKKNVGLSDLIDHWEAYTPKIIHFSMHGDQGDPEEKIPEGLAFETEGKEADIISPEKLKREFEDLHGDYPIQLAIFNACYSSKSAMEISKLGIHAIGCKDELKEAAAHAFTKKFYNMYSKTKDIEKSVRSGIRAAKKKDEIARHIHLYHNGEKIEL